MPKEKVKTKAVSPWKGRFDKMEQRTKGARQRIRTEAGRREEAIISIGAAAIMGEMKKRKVKLPTVGGLEPVVLYGAVAVAVGPMISKGKGGKRIQAAGAGLLAVAAYNYGRNRSVTLEGQSELGHGHDDDDDDDDGDQVLVG